MINANGRHGMKTVRVSFFVLISACAAAGQISNPAAFESADVHAGRSGFTDGVFIDRGRVETESATMLTLIATAYSVETDMVVGGPNWLDADRFYVAAHAAPSTPDATMRLMLQTMLAERFHLAVHREDRPMPVYALRVGKRGLKLKRSSLKEGPGDCRVRREGATITAECQSIAMDQFVLDLRGMANNYVNHPAVNMTGLQGGYDFTLVFTARGQLRKASDPDAAADITLFAGLEKLGLELEPDIQPRPVIVVDHVDQKPTANPEIVTKAAHAYPQEFEVASVKPIKPGTPDREDRVLPSGQVDLYDSLHDLITFAYNVQDYMVIGPRWLDADRFEIVAKTEPNVPFAAMGVMLRNLLADRFKLAVHRDVQPVDVYALTAGKGAPKLKESSGDARSECKRSVGDGNITLTCQNISMAELVEKLRTAAPGYTKGVPVVDLTGLKGSYDFAFSWAPSGKFNAGAKPGDSASTPTGDLTFFEGIERFLGLKLGLQKHPMEVVVVDHVERTPAEN